MFAILAYDVEAKRTPKVMKIAKKYLTHVQRSVFEGYLTEGKYRRLQQELAEVIIPEKDSIVFYRADNGKNVLKAELGTSVYREPYLI